MAYALDLHKDLKFYNVSLLRRYVSDPNHVLRDLPYVILKGRCWLNLKELCRLICKTLGVCYSRDFLLM